MSHRFVDIRRTIPKHLSRKWKKREYISHIVVHTTASDNQDPNKTARYHITPGKQNHISKKGAPGLAYHDFITKTGIVYHCNNYEDWTWHAGLYNKKSIGVVLAFKGQNGGAPDGKQLIALEEHLTVLCLYLKISPNYIIGHREVPGMFTILGKGSRKYKKSCPGWGIDLDILRTTVSFRLQKRLVTEGLYRSRIDGLFGPKSMAALLAYKPPRPREK